MRIPNPGGARVWRSIAAGTAVTALVASAFVAQGVRSARIDADDAAVWVIARDTSGDPVAGRVNTRIGQYDGFSGLSGSNVDVVQEGRNVVAFSDEAMQIIDPGNPLGSVGGSGGSIGNAKLGSSQLLAIGGGIVAVRSSANGKQTVRAVPFGQLTSAVTASVPASAGARACAVAAAVGPTGRAFAVVAAAKGSGFELAEVAQDGALTTAARLQIGGLDCKNGATTQALQMVVVGDTPVVLSGNELQIGGAVQRISGTGLKLQDAPGTGDNVLVADNGRLREFPLDGGAARTIELICRKCPAGTPSLPATAAAVRPVRVVGGGDWAAWVDDASDELYTAQSTGGRSANVQQLGADGVRAPRWRVNLRNAVLQPPASQFVYVVIDGQLRKVDNAEALTRQKADTPGKQSELSCNDGRSRAPQDSAATAPPVVRPDAVNVRRAQPSVISVLANDRASQCAPLRIESVEAVRGANVDIVKGGAALLVDVTDTKSTSLSFSYTATTVGSRSGSAKVVLTVVGDDVNNPPARVDSIDPISIGVGSTFTTNVLRYFVDPESDPVVLAGAATTTGDSSVQWQPDGTVVLEAPSTPGRIGLGLTVRSAGPLRTESSPDSLNRKVTLDIDVGDAKKVARSDVVTVAPGVPVAIDVRANDDGVAPSDLSEPSAVTPAAPDTSATLNRTSGRYVFRSSKPGDYSFSYEVGSSSGATSQSGGSSRASVLVHVAEVTSSPHALPDFLRVAPGRSGVSEVIANDDDPSGNVLVVSDASVVDQGDPVCRSLTARVVDGRAVQADASGLPNGHQCSVRYTVSAGTRDATGTLTIVTDESTPNPVLANADRVTALVGGTAVVPVLANDRIASGESLAIDAATTVTGARIAAVAGADGTLRIVVPKATKPGTAIVGYTARGASDGDAASGGVVRVDLRAASADSVGRLVADDIEARSIVKQPGDLPTCIAVPSAAIGTNGGPAVPIPKSAATADRAVVAVPGDGRNCPLSAIAFWSTERGTHQFRYILDDGLSTSSEGSVIVGVGPRVSQQPRGVDDTFHVRPGRTRVLDVLANDVNPSEAALEPVVCRASSSGNVAVRLDARTKKLTATVKTAQAAGSRVSVAYAPVVAGTTRRCAAGSSAIVTLVVDPKATVPPVAVDDTAGAPRNGVVSVPVLDNDSDPDGASSLLKVGLDSKLFPTAAVKSTAGTQRVEVEVTEDDQWIPYTVTDSDGLQATAVVHVLGTTVRLLVACPGGAARPLEAKAGRAAVTLDLTGRVCAANGVPAGFVLVANQRISDGNGGTVSVDGSGQHTLRFVPPPVSPAYTTVLSVRALPAPAPNAARAVAIPIVLRVAGNRNSPPLLDSANATVTQGSEVQLSLRASDPDGDAVRYSIVGASSVNGVGANVDSRTGIVRVSAKRDVRPATRVTFVAAAADGRGGTSTSTIAATVAKQAVDTPRAQAPVVLSYSQNPSVTVSPFEGLVGDGGWKIVGCPPVPRGMRLECTTGSTNYRVVLDPRQRGATTTDIVVQWRDDFGNVGSASQRVVVIQPPSAPKITLSGSTAADCASSVPELTFTWGAVDAGGGSVTYSAQASSGTVTVAGNGTGTVATVRGATRSSDFSITVRAVNESGPGPVSSTPPTSLAATPCWQSTPDIQATAGDRSATVTWAPATDRANGAGVEYRLVAATLGDTKAATTTATSTTFSGLNPAQAYTVSLQACVAGSVDPNQCTDAGVSASAVPYTAASKHGVTLAESNNQVVASTDPDLNDLADQTRYVVTFYESAGCGGTGQSADGVVQGNSVSAVGPSIARGQQYSARVEVTNRAGTTGGDCSSAFSFYKNPDPPTVTAFVATGVSQQAKLTLTLPSDLGGAQPQDLSVITTAGAPGAGCSTLHAGSNDCLIGALTNGQTANIGVSLRFTKDSTYTSSAVSATSNGTVYGPPSQPAVSASVSGTTITFSWSIAANGRSVDAVETSFDGGASWHSPPSAASESSNPGYSATVCLTVRGVSAGQRGPSASACGTTPAPPPPPGVSTSCNGPIKVPCNIALADGGYGRPSSWPVAQCGGPCIAVGTPVHVTCQKYFGSWPGNMVYLQWNSQSWWGFDVDYGYPGVPQCP